MESFQVQCLYCAEQAAENGKYWGVVAGGIPLPYPVGRKSSPTPGGFIFLVCKKSRIDFLLKLSVTCGASAELQSLAHSFKVLLSEQPREDTVMILN